MTKWVDWQQPRIDMKSLPGTTNATICHDLNCTSAPTFEIQFVLKKSFRIKVGIFVFMSLSKQRRVRKGVKQINRVSDYFAFR
jgi:hypothetical protein